MEITSLQKIGLQVQYWPDCLSITLSHLLNILAASSLSQIIDGDDP